MFPENHVKMPELHPSPALPKHHGRAVHESCAVSLSASRGAFRLVLSNTCCLVLERRRHLIGIRAKPGCSIRIAECSTDLLPSCQMLGVD